MILMVNKHRPEFSSEMRRKPSHQPQHFCIAKELEVSESASADWANLEKILLTSFFLATMRFPVLKLEIFICFAVHSIPLLLMSKFDK